MTQADWLTFCAALGALVVSLFTAFRQWRAAQELWLRELRLPRYVELLRAAEDYDTSIHLEYGDWDPQDNGPPPPNPTPLADANRAFYNALHETAFVGPESVALAARRLSFAIRNYRSTLEGSGWASYARILQERNAFTAAAAEVMGLRFTADDDPTRYMEWLTEMDERDAEDERRREERHAAWTTAIETKSDG